MELVKASFERIYNAQSLPVTFSTFRDMQGLHVVQVQIVKISGTNNNSVR